MPTRPTAAWDDFLAGRISSSMAVATIASAFLRCLSGRALIANNALDGIAILSHSKLHTDRRCPILTGGTSVSIVRIGLAETKHFAEGYDAIFGKKKGTQQTKKGPAAKNRLAKTKKTTKKK